MGKYRETPQFLWRGHYAVVWGSTPERALKEAALTIKAVRDEYEQEPVSLSYDHRFGDDLHDEGVFITLWYSDPMGVPAGETPIVTRKALKE